jgi:hypothetical protein
MARYTFPTNIDSTYANDAGDPSVQIHQDLHDDEGRALNSFDNSIETAAVGTILVAGATGLAPTVGESKHIPTVTFDVTAGGNYTFQATDAGTMKGSLTSDATAMVWTVPLNSSVPFPIGTAIKVLQRGIGQITIAGATGVTLNAAGAATKTAAQNAAVVITKLFADVWLVEGGVV